MAADIKNRIARAFEESWGSGDLNALDEVYGPNYAAHSAEGENTYNIEAEKAFIADTRNSFSDSTMKTTHAYQDGDTVIIRWVWTGKHTGESKFMPMAPTNKEVELRGCTFCRIENGKVAEAWGYSNDVHFYKQLGIMPENIFAEADTDRTPRGENL